MFSNLKKICYIAPIEKIFAYISGCAVIICLGLVVLCHIGLSKQQINSGIPEENINVRISFKTDDLISNDDLSKQIVENLKDCTEMCRKGEMIASQTTKADFALVKVMDSTLFPNFVSNRVKIVKLFNSDMDVQEGDEINLETYTFVSHYGTDKWETTQWMPWMQKDKYYLISYQKRFDEKIKNKYMDKLQIKLPEIYDNLTGWNSWLRCVPVTTKDTDFLVTEDDGKEYSDSYTMDEIRDAQFFTTSKAALKAWNEFRSTILDYYLGEELCSQLEEESEINVK